MHSVSPAFSRSSSSIRSSIRSRPALRQARPVAPRGRAVGRQLGQLLADLVERQADPLGEDDEGDPAQHGPRVAAVARAGPLRADQVALLVEAQRRGGDAAAARHLADGQQLGHADRENHDSALTSSSLELVPCPRMSDERTPEQRITDEVTSWPGVEAGPGRRGEFAFTVGRREIGHLHGDRTAHFGFPKDVWQRAVRRRADRLPPGLPRAARLRRPADRERRRRPGRHRADARELRPGGRAPRPARGRGGA